MRRLVACGHPVMLALLLVGTTAAAPPRLKSLAATRALAAGLARSGRAEATLQWDVVGPPGSAPTTLHGTLAMEPPNLARLDVPATGERITLRADGGEWLQPKLHQLLRLTPRYAGAAMRWWRLMAGAEPADERQLAPARFRLVLSGTPEAAADSADVWLDAHGLPSRLALADGMGGSTTYRLRGWRFTRARGASAFRITTPPGIEAVDAP